MNLPEEQLIDLCKKRDRKAQKQLYSKYASVLLGICMRYSASKHEAEDILQEAFIRIFNHISQFNGMGSFEGWLKRIVVNTAITAFHRNKKHNRMDDIDEILETDIEGYSLDDAEFTHEELLKIINMLPEGYKMVFNLYAIEGYKHKEIADLLNIDVNTSKSQFSRARKLIQTKLEEVYASKTRRTKIGG